jgi:hypothetical protein
MHALDAPSPCLVAEPDPVDEGLIAIESDGVTHLDYRVVKRAWATDESNYAPAAYAE